MLKEMFWIATGNIGRWLVEISDSHLDPLYQRHIVDKVKETL